MIQESTRALTANERRVLEGLRSSPSSGGATFAAFLTFLVTLGVLLILTPSSWGRGVRSLAPVAVALFAATLVFGRVASARWRRAWRQDVERDLREGVAAVTTYRVMDAIQVEEAEDEGSQYYLLLEDGRVVFLIGQYLYEAEEEGRFPSTEVHVVRAPRTRTVFELECEGMPFPPSSRRPPFTGIREWRPPQDGALLDVDFEALRQGPAA